MPWLKLSQVFAQLAWAGAGIGALNWDEPWMNSVLRGGIVAWCFTNAIFPFPASFWVAKLLKMPPGRALQLRWTGTVVTLMLIGIGALITRQAVGYLIAACAFFVGCLYWWVLQRAEL
jgi:hypothetical protein